MLALAALLASGAIGIDMDQTVAFQAFAFVVCLLAVSVGAALFFRGRFTVERLLPRFGSVGQPFSYHLKVRNNRARSFRDLEVLENLSDPRPTRAEFPAPTRFDVTMRGIRVTRSQPLRVDNRQAVVSPVALPVLSARGVAEARVELLPLKRGPLRFTGVTVARMDPFRLFRGFVRVPLPETVLILPRRYPLPDITLPGTRNTLLYFINIQVCLKVILL